MIDWCKRYASLGLPVFPVGRNKAPMISNGFLAASTEDLIIDAWWQKWPSANIGIAIPKDLMVVDVDHIDAIQEMKVSGYDLPATAVALTSRGKHFWYRIPSKYVGSIRPKVSLFPGVDIRAHGSYVVAPPSIHESGKDYEWEVNPLPENISECPEWLVELSSQSQFGTDGIVKKSLSPEDVLDGVSEGQRDITLFRYACHLRRRGVKREEAEILVAHAANQCSPVFPHSQALRKVDQAWKYKAAGDEEKRGSAIISLKDLMAAEYPAPKWLVEGLLPEGLMLISAPPKTGKSFIMSSLGLAVSTGEMAFGEYNTNKGGVLYLDLEQSPAMAKERWKLVLNGTPPPDNFNVLFEFERMDRGGMKRLEQIVEEYNNIDLVVIDLLAKFWPTELGDGQGSNAYYAEYNVLSQLQDFGNKYGCCVAVVHHTNKLLDIQNPINGISGTAAMSGVPRTIWVGFPDSQEENMTDVSMYITGKDVVRQWMKLKWSGRNWITEYSASKMNTTPSQMDMNIVPQEEPPI